jgi:choline dehydrogenase-like flavoprotein
MPEKCEFIIVGSGAGGATLAKELSQKGKQVLVIEKGKPETKLGTIQDSIRFYDGNKLTKVPLKSKEGVILYRSFQSGGTTVVSCGNGVRSLEKEFSQLGINLSAEFVEAEKDTRTGPIAEKLLSEGSQAIRQAAGDLGYKFDLMPKFINADKCQKCSMCVFGCSHGAKWTAHEFLDEATKNKAEVMYGTTVNSVLTNNGKATGVSVTGPQGRRDIMADTIVLAAGGLGTPVILQQSGIKEAGKGLFMDLLVNTYGITSGLNLLHEPTMALVDLDFHQTKGFLLSPFTDASKVTRFNELGVRGTTLPVNKMLGIMTKITDEPSGTVYSNSNISKAVTRQDRERLDEGSRISREILIKAGADPKSIMVSTVQGAHPGGTAAIGKVVDKDLQTKIDGLFVCDCSVFPTTPGLPPILTIVALAKRLAKTLAN